MASVSSQVSVSIDSARTPPSTPSDFIYFQHQKVRKRASADKYYVVSPPDTVDPLSAQYTIETIDPSLISKYGARSLDPVQLTASLTYQSSLCQTLYPMEDELSTLYLFTVYL